VCAHIRYTAGARARLLIHCWMPNTAYPTGLTVTPPPSPIDTWRVSMRVLARPEGFEPPTPWSEATCSSPLSYGRVLERAIIVRLSASETAGG
jgi:hypothetical protein